MSDPVGDTLSDSRVAVPPDLVHASIDVANGHVTIDVTLAPGTLDRQTTRVTVLLDADSNGSSGIRQGDGLGADFSLDLAAATGQATIGRADPAGCAARLSCFTPVGSAPIAFTADGMQTTVALSTLGSGDGHMSFQLGSYVLVAPSSPVAFDFMPDYALSPGRTQ